MKTLAGFAKGVVVSLLVAYLGIAAFLYLAQDLLIFPLLSSRIVNSQPPLILPPEGITRFFVNTPDNEKIDVWTSLQEGESPELVAMIFHGNGETVAKGNFLPFFRSLGIPAFTFDYRGYGNSSGWPSEETLYSDSELVWEEIKKRTGITAGQLILLGNSLGSGPASYMAKKLKPRALILLAAYSDFPSLISEMPLYAPFRPVLRYRLPVAEYLAETESPCIILAHGKQDEVIPFSNLERLRPRVRTQSKLVILESEDAMHNNIFYKVEDQLKAATRDCLNSVK